MARFAVLAGFFATAALQVVNADFIIWNYMDPDLTGNTYATSAGEMNCAALGNGNSGQTQFAWADDTNFFGDYAEGPITQSSQSFHITTGMCGASQLDAYYDANNDLWNVYTAGGNDDVQGQCFKTQGAVFNCPADILGDDFDAGYILQCNSYLCR